MLTSNITIKDYLKRMRTYVQSLEEMVSTWHMETRLKAINISSLLYPDLIVVNLVSQMETTAVKRKLYIDKIVLL